jgi:hypothetical protein
MRSIRPAVLAASLIFTGIACDADERIAELEAQLETQKQAAATDL